MANWPVAVDDFYSTPVNTPLVVPAPGVLANDRHPSGERIEALYLLQYAELKYGTLLMPKTDGSFTYLPRMNANGQDQFKYLAIDHRGYADEATVWIDVGVFNRTPRVANPIANVTVDQGAVQTVIDLVGVFTDADLSRGDQLRYTVTVSPPILPIVDQISQSSYADIHSNLLYTHLGDSRGYGSPQHDLARDNIFNYFQSLGLASSLDVITEVEGIFGWYHFNPPIVNVVGVKPGVGRPDQVYIVGAHYDSVHNPGADDNASGVAAVMEIARVLSAYSFDATIEFVAFDGEEDGLWGSMHYAEWHTGGHDVLGMISLDMIAYNQPGEGHDVVGIFDSDEEGLIKSKLIEAFDAYGKGVTAFNAGALDLSDHAPFEWFGMDAALVIESAMVDEPFANEHYHQPTDAVETPNYIDYTYATKITGAIAGYLAQEAGVVGTVDVLSAMIVEDRLILQYDPRRSGGATITVRATDAEGLFAEDSFAVTVLPGADATPPAISSLSPADNATQVARDANLVIVFDENILQGQGNVVIKKASDHSVVETIAVLSGSVIVSGTRVTIDPTVTLAEGTEYYVEVAPGAFRDLAGNDFAGIAGASTWNFITADVTPPAVTINQAPGQPDPTNQSPVRFAVVFSETVSGFGPEDVTLGGTAGPTTAVVTGSGSTYEVAVSGMTSRGMVTASIAAGGARDAAGNANTAPTSSDTEVWYEPWQNVSNPYDVSNDGRITALDALRLINYLNRNGPGLLPVPPPGGSAADYYDVTADGSATPRDVLLIINYLNRQSLGGQGEASAEQAAAVACVGQRVPGIPALAGAECAAVATWPGSRGVAGRASARQTAPPQRPSTIALQSAAARDEYLAAQPSSRLVLFHRAEDVSLTDTSASRDETWLAALDHVVGELAEEVQGLWQRAKYL